MQVVTEETLVEQLSDLVESTFDSMASETEVNYANVIIMAMRIVEAYSAQNKLQGGDKMKAAKAIIPTIIQVAVEHGKLNEADAANLRNKLETGADIIDTIIQGYILISQNPEFIQMKQKVEEAAAKCWASCKTKCK
jgi:hypothetical protein